ncbi:DUF3322 and DUF2220 domain-containing protein [Bifidobacterium choloepi]|uniref:DUF3322 and DUF2220 domain-containing protein n=1 Tax=Bifidobacterium choloepi TaxID=2614131 RepID=A0A6I5NCC4_9BIFI|nr:DUF3322 and DUF2220 domain-containing protein [Bifidobacterium choloepi]NEG69144.1 hypothetical protein [Bifidobacterium choloepi]
MTMKRSPVTSRDSLVAAISDRLRRSTFETESRWPYPLTVCGRASRTWLEDHAIDVLDNERQVRQWAMRMELPFDEETKLIGTPTGLVVRVVVPDEQAALRAADRATAREFRRQRARIGAIVDAGFPDREAAAAAARIMRDDGDVDFELFIRAALWFRDHDCSALTPRQVPLEGFSAKWLGSPSSAHRRAIATLVGTDRLAMRERPGELRFRYLDPSLAVRPDQIVTSPYRLPAGDVIRFAVIVENKDTYQAMPPIAHAICIFGNGMAAAGELGLLPELLGGGDGPAPAIRSAYWGDLDADGFEILSKVRKAGVPCESFLMDEAAYRRFSRYGTNLREGKKGTIQPREPLPTPGLNRSERDVYEALCTGTRAPGGEPMPVLRLEQERIPLAEAITALEALGFPVEMPS